MTTEVNEESSTEPQELILPPLNDILRPSLDILFIGINPGKLSSTKGHHFANPRNSFWECLNGSGLVNRPLTYQDDVLLMTEFNCGFTNLVPRPSISSKELSRKEILESIPDLQTKILEVKPSIACFLGKQPYLDFVKLKRCELGLQDEVFYYQRDTLDLITNSESLDIKKVVHIFVAPSTSGLFARMKKVEKMEYFKVLKEALDDIKLTK